MEEIDLVRRIASRSMLDRERLESLYHRAIEASSLDGAFVECGCGLGGSAGLLAGVIQASGVRRSLIVCDTFEGLPPSNPAVDKHEDWTEAQVRAVEGTCKSTQAQVAAICQEMAPDVFLATIKGLYAATLPRWPNGPIALLHADADWYYSTMDILVNLWPHVVPGGLIILDDYHFWEGCRVAVTDYFAANPPEPVWTGVSCSVWGRKPL